MDDSTTEKGISYQEQVLRKPISSTELIESGAWWWKNLEVHFASSKNYWIHSNFETVWERSAFLYELSARIEGEYEFKKPWAFLKLREHSLIHSKWDRDPVSRAFEGWKSELKEPAYRRVEDIQEIYMPREGWTLPLTFNLNMPTEELVKAFKKRIEHIKEKSPLKVEDRKTSGLWGIVELMDKGNLGKNGLKTSEQAFIDKVVKAYNGSRVEQSA